MRTEGRRIGALCLPGVLKHSERRLRQAGRIVVVLGELERIERRLRRPRQSGPSSHQRVAPMAAARL